MAVKSGFMSIPGTDVVPVGRRERQESSGFCGRICLDYRRLHGALSPARCEAEDLFCPPCRAAGAC